jgi:hypothetical protein
MSNYVSLAVSRNAGWIYISDLTTYSALPTYWTNEVDLVQSLNAGSLLPTIMDPTQPADQSANIGSPVTFQVTASGQMPLSFQWFFGSNAMLNATTTINHSTSRIVNRNMGRVSSLDDQCVAI